MQIDAEAGSGKAEEDASSGSEETPRPDPETAPQVIVAAVCKLSRGSKMNHDRE